MTLFRDYKNISRGSLTREGKTATADKLMRLINDYPAVGLPVIRSLLVFKWVRKKTWSSELQDLALVDLESEVNLLSQRLQYVVSREVDPSQYPNMDELMELVTNRNYISQAAIPATFKGVLNGLTNDQLLFVIASSHITNDLKNFLRSNGITVNQERAHEGFDLSFVAMKNAVSESLRSERERLDPAHIEVELINERYIKQVMSDLSRETCLDHLPLINHSAKKILESFIPDDKEINQAILNKQRLVDEERRKAGRPPMPVTHTLKQLVDKDRNDFESLRKTYLEKLGSNKISSPRLDKPTGRLSVGNAPGQGLSFVGRERTGSVAGRLSYDEWARFVFSEQAAFDPWTAGPIMRAASTTKNSNRAVPWFTVDENTKYRFITPNSHDNTVTVREIWDFMNIDGGDPGVVRLQMETISKYELILSTELRGVLPRSFKYRQLEFKIIRFYPGGSAFLKRAA